MEIKKLYIVTKESDDKTFYVGDHIVFYENGDIGCVEAKGFIKKENVEEAMVGMEYEVKKMSVSYVVNC